MEAIIWRGGRLSLLGILEKGWTGIFYGCFNLGSYMEQGNKFNLLNQMVEGKFVDSAV